MKNRASVFLKQVVSVLVSVVKAKTEVVKSKTSAMKTRLIIFGLLKNKKVLLAAISHKIHALMGQEYKEGEYDNNSRAIVLYNAVASEASSSTPTRTEWVDEDDSEEEEEENGNGEYPDLRHSLFELDDEEEDDGLVDDGKESVIDLVRNSRDDGGSDFSLVDEIDHVADVFIRRFHKQMKMQKQESFKRYQEMLQRSV